mmetsp:Transcript_6165/g.13161  ORF Transcript_6165/g.13161 Transcript_6165/m.13161 type:complete len:138 (+) Transcript_6165:64-477(+)
MNALRAGRVLRCAKEGGDGAAAFSGGLRGWMERAKVILSTGKLLRQDVADDNLRVPVKDLKYRFPSPASQEHPVIPQGEYKNVFDITYHTRDARRRILRETIEPVKTDASGAELPPVPGRLPKIVHLGYAGEFDRQK